MEFYVRTLVFIQSCTITFERNLNTHCIVYWRRFN